MTKSKKSELEIRKQRIFSEEFKRQKVQQIVDKTISIADLTELYGMSKVSVYRWIYLYSPHHQKGTKQVVQMESEEHKTKQLLQKVAELERIVGQKQLCIDYLEKLIEVSGEELEIDLKKNFSERPSSGSAKTRANTLGK